MTSTDQTPRTTTHTPGPWEHGDNGLIYGQCGEDDVESPFVCDVIEDSAMHALGMLSPVEEANARRIVAAVNACEGIPTESRNQGIVAELLMALTDFFNIMHDYESSIEKGYVQQAMKRSKAAIEQATGRSA
jgi:hypothetical protein